MKFLRKRLNSFYYAGKGLRVLFGTQWNARFHLAAAFGVSALGLWLELARWEWCALFLAFGLVVSAEALNTAVEFLTDLVAPDYNEQAGRVKDVAAGGVLWAALAAVGIAGVVFIPYLFNV